MPEFATCFRSSFYSFNELQHFHDANQIFIETISFHRNQKFLRIKIEQIRIETSDSF